MSTGRIRLRLGTAMMALLIAGLAATSALALNPPKPGEIEKYKQDGTYAARLESSRRLGNYKTSQALANNASYRLSRLAGITPKFAPPLALRGMPTTGTVNVLVLLIKFDGYEPRTNNTVTSIQSKCFGNGNSADTPYESLKEYFYRSSHGKLTINGNVLGWYSAGARPTVDPNADYGVRAAALEAIIKPALTYYKNQGHNFGQYDNNNDGIVDYFAVIWTGPNNGWGSFWWAYQTNWTDSTFKLDGKSFNTFSWQQENEYGINNTPPDMDFSPRTLMHETGHALGLPDYYDYKADVGPNGGIGGLDMMDSGEYDMNAFSKFMLDWITPTVYTVSSSGQISLRNSAENEDAAIIMPEAVSGNVFGEYYMVQNRVRKGNDLHLPTDGLLIWHIDARLNVVGTDFSYNNSETDHKLIRLMEADGLEEIEMGVCNPANAGDFYVSGTSLTNTTTPNSKRYDGSATGITVDSITGTADPRTFNLQISGLSMVSATMVPSTTNQIDVVYNQSMIGSSSAVTASNYSFGGVGATSAALQSDGKTVRISVGSLSPCKGAPLTITGVQSPGGIALTGANTADIILGTKVPYILSDATWTPSGNPYCILNDLTIPAGITVTVQAGTTVKFTANTAANNIYTSASDFEVKGRLVVNGTAASPVVFTSAETTPSSNDWGSIYFANNFQTSTISYLRLSYSLYGIRMDNSSNVIVQFGDFSKCGQSGCINTENSATPLIRNNYFHDTTRAVSLSSPATVVGNDFFNITEVGLSFNDGGEAAIVKDNNFRNISGGVYNFGSAAANASYNYYTGNNPDTASGAGAGAVVASTKLTARIDRLLALSTLSLKTGSDYASNLASNQPQGSTLYIQIEGADADTATVNQTIVTVKSGATDTTGIYAVLTETGASTGIYRGTVMIGAASSQANSRIGAANGEVITIASVRDSSRNATVTVGTTADNTPPFQSAWSPTTGSTVTASSTTITLTTNENATCRWSLTDQAYYDMASSNACTGTGTTSQSCAVTGLTNGTAAVSIACIDTAGNAQSTASNTDLFYTVELAAPGVCGDYDGDGNVRSNDILAVARIVMGVNTATAAQKTVIDVAVRGTGTTDNLVLSNDLLLIRAAAEAESITAANLTCSANP